MSPNTTSWASCLVSNPPHNSKRLTRHCWLNKYKTLVAYVHIPNSVEMDQTAQTLKFGTRTYVLISINKQVYSTNVANFEILFHRKSGTLNSYKSTVIQQNVRCQSRARQYSPLRKKSFYFHVNLLPFVYHSNNTSLFFNWRGKCHNKTDTVQLLWRIKPSAVILKLTMGMESFSITD
jgi:hypothetical protein